MATPTSLLGLLEQEGEKLNRKRLSGSLKALFIHFSSQRVGDTQQRVPCLSRREHGEHPRLRVEGAEGLGWPLLQELPHTKHRAACSKPEAHRWLHQGDMPICYLAASRKLKQKIHSLFCKYNVQNSIKISRHRLQKKKKEGKRSEQTPDQRSTDGK